MQDWLGYSCSSSQCPLFMVPWQQGAKHSRTAQHTKAAPVHSRLLQPGQRLAARAVGLQPGRSCSKGGQVVARVGDEVGNGDAVGGAAVLAGGVGVRHTAVGRSCRARELWAGHGAGNALQLFGSMVGCRAWACTLCQAWAGGDGSAWAVGSQPSMGRRG